MPDGIEILRLIHKPENNLLCLPLLLEGPEHPVPNNQHADVILVQTIPIGTLEQIIWQSCSNFNTFLSHTMVDAMVLRGVEDVLERSQGPDDLSVDPKLVEGVELGVDHHVGRWDKESHGHVEHLEQG